MLDSRHCSLAEGGLTADSCLCPVAFVAPTSVHSAWLAWLLTAPAGRVKPAVVSKALEDCSVAAADTGRCSYSERD